MTAFLVNCVIKEHLLAILFVLWAHLHHYRLADQQAQQIHVDLAFLSILYLPLILLYLLILCGLSLHVHLLVHEFLVFLVLLIFLVYPKKY